MHTNRMDWITRFFILWIWLYWELRWVDDYRTKEYKCNDPPVNLPLLFVYFYEITKTRCIFVHYRKKNSVSFLSFMVMTSNTTTFNEQLYRKKGEIISPNIKFMSTNDDNESNNHPPCTTPQLTMYLWVENEMVYISVSFLLSLSWQPNSPIIKYLP